MKVLELKKNSQTLIPKCRVASDFFSRFMGLMGKSMLSTDESIIFPKCNSIHTFFMRIPIDVLFVNKAGSVLEVLNGLGPWKMLLPRSGARHVIEMKAGLAKELGIQVGDSLWLEGIFG